MSEELQNDSFEMEPEVEVSEVNAEQTPEVIENPESGTELAPETSEKAEVNEEDGKQKKISQAFSKQYKKTKLAERENEELKEELQRIKQAAIKPPPVVGKFPQEYDYDTTEEYLAAQTAYSENIRANERHAAQTEAAANHEQARQYEAQQKQQEKIQTDINSYTENATKFGISESDLKIAARAVADYNISDGVTLAILSEPEGPLITTYLAANPEEVGLLNSMNPYQAGAYISTLKAKVSALKPKTSNTPAPATNLQGNGAQDKDKYQNLGGVTFS